MPDFSRFLIQVERRARRITALRRSGPIFLSAAALVLAVQTILFFVARYSFGLRISSAIAGGLLSASLIAYIAQRSRKVRLPAVLLRIDQALNLEARISSLYELRQTAGNRVLRTRIERHIGDRLSSWRKGLPWGVLGWSTHAAGLVLTVGVIMLSTVPAPAIATVSPSDVSPPLASQQSPATQLHPSASTTSRPRTDDADPSRDSSASISSPSGDDVRLEDDLAAMGELDTPDSLVGDTRMDEVDQLMARQEAAARALSEMLEKIRERMQQQGGGLTQEEQQQLRNQMAQGLNPETEQALRDLLSETDPESLQDMMDDLSQTLSGTPAEETGEQPSDDEGQPSLAIDLDEQGEWQPPSSGQEDGEANGESQDDHGAASGPESEGSEDPSPSDAGPEGEDEHYAETAGDEGLDAEQEEDDRPEASFTNEESPFSIGDEGEFTDFLSKGVPVEPAMVPSSGSILHSISFEQIDALLAARSLSQDTAEAVREYFTRITQGGS